MALLFVRPAEWERRYNCALVQVDAIPLEQRQFFGPSVAIILLCAVYYVLYVPCAVSIWRRMRNNSCYQLLFYIACLDLGCLWGVGFYVGWMSLSGRVFCSAPRLNYAIALLTISLSVTELVADLVLALNRTINMLSSRTEEALFSGRAIYVWVLLSAAYGVYWFLTVSPMVYSRFWGAIHFQIGARFSTYFGGFFYDPYMGYNVSTGAEEYGIPWMHTAISYEQSFLIPAIYVVFLVGFLVRLNAQNWNFGQSDVGIRQQLSIFLQVFLISVFNASAGIVFMYAQTLDSLSPTVLMIGQFGWFHIHGAPPLIFLCLNKTIRNDSKQLLRDLIGAFGRGGATNSPVKMVVAVNPQQQAPHAAGTAHTWRRPNRVNPAEQRDVAATVGGRTTASAALARTNTPIGR